ncbi:hypothetical protein MPSEU_000541400 [Mayamaea pseudoterrestris]|nr:hypothetical protein MPSEU_000541400 [Mayamaea pseudoterrestris]
MHAIILIKVLLLTLVARLSKGFTIASNQRASTQRIPSSRRLAPSSSEASSTSTTNTAVPVDTKKEAVKIFGRLAEKYIMLDALAGQCCYSGCSDCEFRLPGGGYRMADQSSARPKWIPNYSMREANGKKHETKWAIGLFPHGDEKLNMGQFVQRIRGIAYAPPLGGPSVSASDATIENNDTAEAFFVLLVGGEEKLLSKKKFSKRLKQLANGEEGLTYAAFQIALGL